MNKEFEKDFNGLCKKHKVDVSVLYTYFDDTKQNVVVPFYSNKEFKDIALRLNSFIYNNLSELTLLNKVMKVKAQ